MALPAILGGLAAGIGGAAASKVLGGGGGGSAGGSMPVDYYAMYGAQAAAANNPLTAAMQGLAVLQGSFGGALGLEGSTIASSQLSVLKEALDQAQKQTATQASITAASAGAGLDVKKQEALSKLGTELSAPALLGQAGSAALAGENQLASLLAQSNVGLKTLQEQTRANVAQTQANTLADVFRTRAETEGRLALGSQARETGLQMTQAKTLSDLATIKGQTKAQLAIKQYGANQALAGQRFFA